MGPLSPLQPISKEILMPWFRKIALWIFPLFCIGSVQADITLRFLDQPDGAVSTIMVKDGKVRIEDTESQGERNITIFDSATGKLLVLVEQERAYSEFTEQGLREQVTQMQGMLQGVQKEMMGYMEEAMRDLSPEERSAMEQQMGRFGMGSTGKQPAELPKLTTRRTGRTQTVAGVRCEIHEGYLDQEKTHEACVASPADLRVSAADHRALVAMFDFMARMAELASETMGMGDMGIGRDFAAEFKDGIPVQLRDLETGGVSVLQDRSAERLGVELFKVPAGYTRMDLF
jgi:hypothetical protein